MYACTLQLESRPGCLLGMYACTLQLESCPEGSEL